MAPLLSCLLEGDIHTFLLIHQALAAPAWIGIPTPGVGPHQEALVGPHLQQAMLTPPESVLGIQEDFFRVPAARSRVHLGVRWFGAPSTPLGAEVL